MARHIPDDVIDQIRTRADIVDVVTSYVPNLKKSGPSAWKACCPFHQEKTPSFQVNQSRQAFKCFGCGKGGSIFTFVMEIERLDFPNAVELLARKYGVMIPEPEPFRRSGANNTKTSEDSTYSLRERLFLLHEKLASWYAKKIKDEPESKVAQYLKNRNIPLEFVNRFMIGASPDSWDATMLWAKREGFTDEEIRASGIVTENKSQNGKYYDRFRNRLMFPIWNEQGRVVAFSARTVEKESTGGKYVNSPESPVFKKSRILYGLHLARGPISEKGYAVLCEGQLDVIAMHRAGCVNAVAPQGTAFGEEQASILKRYTQSVALALDNDVAGKNAVFKNAAILLPMGIDLKVVRYSDAKDADEVLNKHGADALRDAVENAPDFFEFAFECATQENDISNPAGRSTVASMMITHILLLDNYVTQDSYISWLSEKSGVTRDALVMELERKKNILAEAASKQEFFEHQRAIARTAENDSGDVPLKKIPLPSEQHPRLKKSLKELLEVIINDQTFAGIAEAEILPEMLDGSPLAIAIEIVIQTKYDGEWETAGTNILAYLEKNAMDNSDVTDILAKIEEKNLKKEVIQKTFDDCIRNIKEFYYKNERARLSELASKSTSESEQRKYLTKAMEYTRLIVGLSQRKKKVVAEKKSQAVKIPEEQMDKPQNETTQPSEEMDYEDDDILKSI